MDLQVFCQPIWNGVVKVALPCKAGLEDKLIWRAAKDGNLSVALAYELKRTHFPRVPWARFVWNSCFRPRNSMILWKFMHGRLLTDDLATSWFSATLNMFFLLS